MKEKLMKWTRKEENKEKLQGFDMLGMVILIIVELIFKIAGLILGFMLVTSIIKDLFEKDESTIMNNKFIFIVLSGEQFLASTGLIAYIMLTCEKLTITSIEGFIAFVINMFLTVIIAHELSKIFANVFLK